MHFPVPTEQAKRFQLAVAEHFGLNPNRTLSIDVSHTGGDARAFVEARLWMPAEMAVEMFNAAAEETKASTINDRDLRVDTFMTEAWDNPTVRIIHLPTGRVVKNHDTSDKAENAARARKALEEMLNGADR